MRGDQFFIEVSKRPPFTKLHPEIAAFFKDYFAHEKAIRFGDQMVVNTHFPPYPSQAFDHLAEGFSLLGDAEHRRLYSVALAVTNRCTFDCWHCYNAGRSQQDLPLETLAEVVSDLQDLGAVMVTLTGGEPLLRDDLEHIVQCFDERSCIIVGTTGAGLSADRAMRLRDSGVFGVGISLDAVDPREHDRMRGREGAFRLALEALDIARRNGLYPYVVSVATRAFLDPDHFTSFLRLAADAGALEVHLLEPSATGNLADHKEVCLSATERRSILDYQEQVAHDDDLPILSSYTYLESAGAFGCGAALTHLYIDGSGEVCPCQFVPLSFGNVAREPLGRALQRMEVHFRQPRSNCVGKLLSGRLSESTLPAAPEESAAICDRCLQDRHALPRFFKIHSQARAEVGQAELASAYDSVHEDYDAFWLEQAARPIDDLVETLGCRGDERLFEAGCGTGYATALLAPRVRSILAVDLSQGMLAVARRRLESRNGADVQFVADDALAVLASAGPFEVIFSSWVLGYIPLEPFFAAARGALAPDGRLAFVVHKENSPREPSEIFAELVARDPSVLQKRVAFDFPRDLSDLRARLLAAGFKITDLREGQVVFRYDRPELVLEHLLKSGAGTAFYEAIDPGRRLGLADEFVTMLADRCRRPGGYEVGHDYVACIARNG